LEADVSRSRSASARLKKDPVPTTSVKPRSKLPLVLGGIALYAMSVYGAYMFLSLDKTSTDNATVKVPVDASEQEDISHVYDEKAKIYDSLIRKDEFVMGMPLLRRALAKRAKVSTQDHKSISSTSRRYRGAFIENYSKLLTKTYS
jgi:methyltransferase OMS1